MIANYLGEILSVLTAALWAVAVILFKKTGETVHPLSLNLFKNVSALVVFVPTVLVAGEPLVPDVSGWHVAVLALSGVLGITVADTLFFMSLNRLGANLTAIVDAMYTPFVMVIVSLGFGERVTLPMIGGAALIISAVLVSSIRSEDLKLRPPDLVVGVLYGALSMFFMALGVVMLKKPLWGRPPVFEAVPIVWATAFRLLAATAPLVLFLLARRERGRYFRCFRPSHVWKVMVPGSLLGTYLSMLAWLLGWKLTTYSSVAAVLNQLSLIFVAVLAAIFLRERLTPAKALAIVMAITGVAITVMA